MRGPLTAAVRGVTVRGAMALMLVHDPGPPDPPDRPRRRLPRPPVEPFAWIAAVAWCLTLAGRIGGFGGYLVLLGMVVGGSARLERWSARIGRDGLRDHRQ